MTEFTITVEPSPENPRRWTWVVQWNRDGVYRSKSGPDGDRLPSAEDAKLDAQCFADAMADALVNTETYSYTPKKVDRA